MGYIEHSENRGSTSIQNVIAAKQKQSEVASVERNEASYLTTRMLMYFLILSAGYVMAIPALFGKIIYSRFEKSVLKKN